MKTLAQSHVWWPGIDQDVEGMMKACTACQEVKNTSEVAPLYMHGFGSGLEYMLALQVRSVARHTW